VIKTIIGAGSYSLLSYFPLQPWE